MNIALVGPPGSGKGTQANALREAFNIPHIASGKLFREHIKNQTELGILANSYIKKGQLVPDNVTESLVKERRLIPIPKAPFFIRRPAPKIIQLSLQPKGFFPGLVR